MTCWVCNPVCDNCKPKFIECPACHDRCFLNEPTCRKCGYAFTDDERFAARELWKSEHRKSQ